MAKKKTAKKPARKANAAFMRPVSPDAALAEGRRPQAHPTHRSHQEAVGLHQEERAAGQEEQAHDQR